MATIADVVHFQLLILTLFISSVMGNLKVLNFTQSLDHFDGVHFSDLTFQQKLVVSDTHWAGAKSKAPIFVLLGSFRDPIIDPNTYGILSLSAFRFKAMLVSIEHRFTGDSVPLGSINLAMANHHIRSYLTVKQALQDYCEIIQSLKANLSAYNSPVIVVGMGYGGGLATWFRQLNPEIAIGALASSSPMLYYGYPHPGHGYCTIVSNDFKDVDQKCYEMIHQSMKIIDNITLESNGLARLSQTFKTCRPLQSSEEVKQKLAQLFSNIAQSDDQYSTEIKFVCNLITNEKDPLAGMVSALFRELDGGECFDNNLIDVDSPFEPPSNETMPWAWLRCTGLVYPIGCEHDTMLPSRPFNMTRFQHECKKRFGVVRHPHSPITFFHTKNLEESLTGYGRNIIFSNGLKDPFSSGGILKNLSKNIVAVTAAKGTYCWDMKPIKLDDPEWMKQKREEELRIFAQWISKGSNLLACKYPMVRCCNKMYVSEKFASGGVRSLAHQLEEGLCKSFDVLESTNSSAANAC